LRVISTSPSAENSETDILVRSRASALYAIQVEQRTFAGAVDQLGQYRWRDVSDELPALGDQYRSFAERLRSLAMRFDSKAILDWTWWTGT
jgi:hypothetical protein